MDTQANQAPNTVPLTRKKKKKIWIGVIFVIACLLCGVVLNDILRQKWNYKSNNGAQQIVTGYYREKDHSLDVLCLGASTVRNGISGLQMFKDYGFTTYSRATSIQIPAVSYYLLEETLSTQDIKAVVLDITPFLSLQMDNQDSLAGKIHEAVDYMPWSKYKYNIIKEAINMDIGVSFMDFLLPIYTYHDRWSQLNRDDFYYHNWVDSYVYKGQYPSLVTGTVTYPDGYMSDDDEFDGSFYITDNGKEYIFKILNLCNEKNIEAVFMKAPTISWSIYKHNLVDSFLTENKAAFIDFNEPYIQEVIGFDPKKDFADTGRHPNITGAVKLSKYIGEYLTSLCNFEDKRNNPDYSSWHENYNQYAQLLKDIELSRETNLIGYLEKLKDPNYITMLTTRDDTSEYYNEGIQQAFSDLGINAPFGEYKSLSYLAILDGASVVYEQIDDDPMDNENELTYLTQYEDHSISLVSNANQLTDNRSAITFDGESVSPNSRGFNFVVFDKKVGQIISRKAFNTGLNGKIYNAPNPFIGLSSDPVNALLTMNNDDYIAVIGIDGDGVKYIPGSVNQQLINMGLIPLTSDLLECPYIAVLNGSQVVYNKYGEKNSELSVDLTIDGINVTAVSNTVSGKENFFAQIDAEMHKAAGKGFCVHVFSKKNNKSVAKFRFIWKNNLATNTSFTIINNIHELLTVARNEEDSVFCLCSPYRLTNGIPEDVLIALKEYGFTMLNQENHYIGVLQPGDECIQQNSPDPIDLSISIGEVPIKIRANEEENTIIIHNIEYSAKNDGIYLMLYNAEQDAIVAEKYFNNTEDDSGNPLNEVRSNPVEFLEQLKNEDNITVIGVAGDGAKYIPGTVNEQMKSMGLLPLAGEFNRSYLAIMDGEKVVYNEYGSVNGELSKNLEIDGLKVTAVSSTTPGSTNFYTEVGDLYAKTANPGLTIEVYSKSKGTFTAAVRYIWSSNYVTRTDFTKITNMLELLTVAQREGDDILCVYSPARTPDGVEEETLKYMRQYGFKNLEINGYYTGVLKADGECLQESGETDAKVAYDRNGVEVELTGNETESAVVINGVRYEAQKNGLYIVVYNAEQDAVLAEKYFTKEPVVTVNPFAAFASTPGAYLAQTVNEEYFTVLGVSGDAVKYIPGEVNDQLVSMGLLPLEGEFGRPYIAILNGEEIVYNEYGEPNTEITAEKEVEGFRIYAVSSSVAENSFFYDLVGNNIQKETRAGLVVCVYDKQTGKIVDKRRFDWTSVNYATSASFAKITNIHELLATAAHDGDDVICLYSPKMAAAGIAPDVLASLHSFGFSDLSDSSNYVGMVQADGQILQSNDTMNPASLEYELNRNAVIANASAEGLNVSFNGTIYQSEEDGLYLVIYNAEKRALLVEKTYTYAPFEVVQDNPVQFLEKLNNNDYISIIGGGMDVSRYIPRSVNDQLITMGLLPMEGKFDSPYLAILDGGKVVFNEYGEPQTVVKAECEIDGIPISATSSGKKGEIYHAFSFEQQNYKKSNKGLFISVFSKRSGKLVLTKLFSWINNYTTETQYAKITNIYELLKTAKNNNDDVLCFYSIEQSTSDVSEIVLLALNKYGFTELTEGNYYAGIVPAQGETVQQFGNESVLAATTRNNMPLTLYSSSEGMFASFDGVVYEPQYPGLYLLIYNEAADTILSEKYY